MTDDRLYWLKGDHEQNAGTDPDVGIGVDASTDPIAAGDPPGNAGTDLLLAGLEWGQDDARPGRLGARPAMLEWRGSRTTIRADAIQAASRNGFPAATGSLLAQMCLAVEREKQQGDPVTAGNPPEDAGCGHGAYDHSAGGHAANRLDGLWVFVARVSPIDDDDTVLWWLGGTEGGRPSHTVPEELCDSLRDLVRALANIVATSPHLAGIAVTPSSADRLLDAIEETAPQVPLPFTVTPLAIGESSGGPDGEGPLFEEPPQHRAATIAAGAIGCVMLAAGMAWYGGLFAPQAPPEPEITFTVPVEGAVRSTCLDGMTRAWPRMPGWRIAATGCARPGSLPNDIPVSAVAANNAEWIEDRGASASIVSGDGVVVAWRAYDRDGEANAVLTAAAAGELVKAHLEEQGSSHGHTTTGDDDGRLVLWRRLPLETRQASPGGFAPVAEIERALAQAFVDVPDAVRVDGNSVTVTVSDPPDRALDRLNAAGPQADLLAVERRDDRTVLRLRPGNGEAG